VVGIGSLDPIIIRRETGFYMYTVDDGALRALPIRSGTLDTGVGAVVPSLTTTRSASSALD
jgi:hypothetical protein